MVWDEDNLKQNEEIQKEYSGVRIQEPKTPYRPPLPSDSLEEDMKPLQLDEGASSSPCCWCQTPLQLYCSAACCLLPADDAGPVAHVHAAWGSPPCHIVF